MHDELEHFDYTAASVGDVQKSWLWRSAVIQDPEVIWLRPTQKLKNAVHIDTVRRL